MQEKQDTIKFLEKDTSIMRVKIHAEKFSSSAERKIEEAGGEVVEK
ncbi:hypothetical protein HRED_09777 [Candidatus Haloredivivus sp. G17]|nr:hypothetical protein HRED_09777 [Candidatus Haloredivivus sp. G17]